uniref:Chemokine interleukin-8-like domain-containing protein n=1 Tax=Podarcis muralis TaxID=64176 RepID=A0A670JMU1_PODMU
NAIYLPAVAVAIYLLKPLNYSIPSLSLGANCCLNYVNKPIPCKAIKYYERASSTCAKPAVMGAQLCMLKVSNTQGCLFQILRLVLDLQQICADPAYQQLPQVKLQQITSTAYTESAIS